MGKKKIDFKFYNIIATFIILILVPFAVLINILSFQLYSFSITDEQTINTQKTAEFISTMLDGDQINTYLQTDNSANQVIQEQLVALCQTQSFERIIILKQEDDQDLLIVFSASNHDNGHNLPAGSTLDKQYSTNVQDLLATNSEHRTIIKSVQINKPNVISLVPLKDSDNNTVAYIYVEKDINGLQRILKFNILIIGSTTIVLLIISLIIAHKFMKKNIVQPLNTILLNAQTFINENLKQKTRHTTAITRVKELNGLINAIDKMETDTIQYVENLTTMAKEQEKINTELKLANHIQQSVLPNTFPAFPDRNEFEIYASMHPAKEIGGDLYDFFFIDDDHLAFTIADVAGKGIPAALLMMNVKIFINEYSFLKKTPAAVLTAVNNRICQNNPNNMFITTWLGVIELSSGKLIYANAGHEAPAILKDGNFTLHQSKHDLVLGAMPNYQYTNYTLQLAPQDVIFLYTDGVTEATKNDHQMYGTKRMLTNLNKNVNQDVENLVKKMEKSVKKFEGEDNQFDDITMLCLKYKGGQPS